MAETRRRGAASSPGRLAAANEWPELKTEAEAAAWYDTHDTSRLPSKAVRETDSGARSASLETIAVRVSRREVEELKRRADRLGIGYTTYVRILITRHVLEEAPIG